MPARAPLGLRWAPPISTGPPYPARLRLGSAWAPLGCATPRCAWTVQTTMRNLSWASSTSTPWRGARHNTCVRLGGSSAPGVSCWTMAAVASSASSSSTSSASPSSAPGGGAGSPPHHSARSSSGQGQASGRQLQRICRVARQSLQGDRSTARLAQIWLKSGHAWPTPAQSCGWAGRERPPHHLCVGRHSFLCLIRTR